MKIGILTHPQTINYGGILQCYALSTFLKQYGYDVWVIKRNRNLPRWKIIVHSLIDFFHLSKLFHRGALDYAANIAPFPKLYLNRTKPIYSNSEMYKVCKHYGLNAVIVGSDQVWRADYALNYGYNYFLDFVPKGINRVSYAASFGLSTWDYTQEQTRRIKAQFEKYKGLSVREEEAIALCKEHLGIDVVQMPDPTMLLTVADYDKVASPRLIKEKYVFVYWLGEKKAVEETIVNYESQGYKVIYVGLREQRIFPSIEDWLSYVKFADLVFTDSFHGCVFTLLYHRPLEVRENKSGGYGRIVSLLHMFGLDGKNSQNLSNKDYGLIEKTLVDLRKNATLFIENSLR